MLAFITFLVAVLSLILVLVLFYRLLQVDTALKLKKFRSKDAGLSDLLTYAAVIDDGIIITKGGALMASWLYRGKDNASCPAEEIEEVSRRINQSLVNLDSGWMLHVDSVRYASPHYPNPADSAFPDAVTKAIDEERRALFNQLGNMYEGYFILTLTWHPPLLVQQKFLDLLHDDDTPDLNPQEKSEKTLTYFKEQISVIENRLSSVFQLNRLKSYKVKTPEGQEVTYDEFLSWLQFCVTGENQPMLLPKNPMYLDAYIGGKELWTGIIPKIGNKFIKVVAIEGFPLESYPSILSVLSELSITCRWSSRFIFMEQHEALKDLEKFRKKWKQKVRGFFDQIFNTNNSAIDQNALSMVEDAEGAIADLNSGFVSMGYYTSVVVLMDENKETLELSAKRVEKAVMSCGFVSRVETVNALEAFLGSLPGHSFENIRRPLINTLNLADFLPTSSLWTGSHTAPCPLYPQQSPALIYCTTSGSTPFRLNLHVGDVGHTLILGPTGAGKSTHLALIAAQLRRYKDMSLFVFDKGMSMFALTKAAGGDHFLLNGDDNSFAFCPLQYLETPSDVSWAISWIETILVLNSIVVTPEIHNKIETAIKSMQATKSCTLSDLVDTLQDKQLREALKVYTVSSTMGHLIDAPSDNLKISKFMTFEIEELMNLQDKYALPVLLYLFRRIERSLTSQPAVIILDEAWLMLSNAAFSAKIKEWLKVLRKANCSVILATQSLSDVSNSSIFDVIVESTPTKIFLPNLYAANEGTKELYHKMGLNNQEVSVIANAIPKQEYYYASPEGRRLYSLELGPFSLCFLAVSDKESVAKIKEMEEVCGKEWPLEWVKYKNAPTKYLLGRT